MSMLLTSAQLELKITEKTLGSLVTNAREIKSLVESGMDKYSIENYAEDNIEQAKTDKATLNKAAKDLNDRRIEIEKEFMRPFGEFKDIVSETVSLIKTASANIDTLVKDVDLKAKDEKRGKIDALFSSKGITLVTLSKIFDEKWLNKKASMKSIEAYIDERLAGITSDIGTIEAMQELGMEQSECDLAKSIYLDTLNLSNAMAYLKKLKENRERVRIEAEERIANRMAVASGQPVEIAAQTNCAAPIAQQTESQLVNTPDQPQLLTRAFRIVATKDQIIALGNFMNSRDISFQKLEL